MAVWTARPPPLLGSLLLEDRSGSVLLEDREGVVQLEKTIDPWTDREPLEDN